MIWKRCAIEVRADRRLGFVDLTEDVRRAVRSSGIADGLCVAFSLHTTCGLIVNEWEDGALEDLRHRIEALFPSDVYYAHDDPQRRTANISGPDEPRNGHAHVAQMVLGGASHVIPVVDGHAVLGTWQRLFLVELDEPRGRSVMFQVMGTPSSIQSRVMNNQNARPA